MDLLGSHRQNNSVAIFSGLNPRFSALSLRCANIRRKTGLLRFQTMRGWQLGQRGKVLSPYPNHHSKEETMRALAIAIASIFSMSLPGCGGGGDSSPSIVQLPITSIPDGSYTGKTSNGKTISGFILDDGSYWVLYSGVNPSYLGGLLQGSGTSINGNFSSTNGKDYSFEGYGLSQVNVSANYVLATSLSGSMTYPSLNQTGTFTASYNKTYELTPSLSAIAGTYIGSSLGDPTTLTISNSGTITGKDVAGCTFSGTIAPRTKGNVYNTAITFGGYPCPFMNSKWSGVAAFDAPSKAITAVVLNAAKDNATVFQGTKP